MSGPRGSVIESSVPDEDLYDPTIGEDMPSDDPPENPDEHGANGAAEAAAEARATRMGWTPFDQYRGDPSKWRPASEWLARADEMLPIAQAMNHSLERKLIQRDSVIDSLKRSVDEQKAVLEDMRRLGQQAEKRGYDKAAADIEKAKRTAVAEGNTELYDQLVEQEEALEEAHADAPAAPAAEPAAPKLSPATQAFVDANKWFGPDQFLTRKMVDRHIDVIQEGEIVDEAEQYDEALARLKADYPERFGAPARQAAAPRPQQPAPRVPRRAAVSPPTPSGAPPRQTGTASINSIADPTERAQAREAFNRMKRQLDQPGQAPYTEAEYMKLYGDPHADVLEVQRASSRKA
jgi:hypothetical protein